MSIEEVVRNFKEALYGGKGDLDAWLECNDEAETRAAIMGTLLQHEVDAQRYQFLKKQECLTMFTKKQQWTRADGSKYYSSHYLAVDDVLCESFESLDETVDEAMVYFGEKK